EALLPRHRVVHGHDNPRLDLADHTDCLGRPDRLPAADRDKQHVDIADLIELMRGQLVPQIAQVTEYHIIQVKHIDGVGAQVGTLVFIVVGAYAGDHNAADLVFAWAFDHEDILAHRLDRGQVGVIGMLVADRDNMCGRLADIQANRAIKWVAYHNPIAPAQPKARVTEILNIRHMFYPYLR